MGKLCSCKVWAIVDAMLTCWLCLSNQTILLAFIFSIDTVLASLTQIIAAEKLMVSVGTMPSNTLNHPIPDSQFLESFVASVLDDGTERTSVATITAASTILTCRRVTSWQRSIHCLSCNPGKLIKKSILWYLLTPLYIVP